MTAPQNPNPYNQPGGWPRQQPPGAQPQPYGPGAQQYPQFATPPPYGQQPPMPYQPGGPYPGRPPGGGSSKVPLIIGGAAVAVVVLGAAAFFVFASGDGGRGIGGGYNNPRDAAQAFVDGKAKNGDLVCKSDLAKISSVSKPTITVTNVPKIDAKITLKSVDVPSGSDEGTFTVDTSVTVAGRNSTQSSTYDLVKEDGGWKVCGLMDGPKL